MLRIATIFLSSSESQEVKELRETFQTAMEYLQNCESLG